MKYDVAGSRIESVEAKSVQEACSKVKESINDDKKVIEVDESNNTILVKEVTQG